MLARLVLAGGFALAACNPAPSTEAIADVPADAPEIIWAHDASDVPVDPAVRYGRLANGLRYAILENDTPTETVALRLRVDAGSFMEDDDQRGLAHMLEHMAFNGSQNVPEGEMIKILERVGLAFGADTNAHTSFEETVYELDLPDASAETLDTAFMLLRETADKLLIAPDAVDRERGVVLSELRAGNTYRRRYQEASWAFLYPGARFVERLPIGLREVLETAPAGRLRDLYEAYYRPERVILVAVGDFDADMLEERIAATFGDWTGHGRDGDDPGPGSVAHRALAAGLFVHPEQPTNISLHVIRPGRDKPDTVANRREDLVRGIGFSALNRRFVRLARDVDARFLSASASHGVFFDAVEQASISVSSEPDAWNEALGVGERELRRALEHGFNQVEIDEVIAGLRSAYQAQADGADTRRTGGLAGSILGRAASDTVFGHPRAALERFEALVSEVTVDDVNRAFREAWGDEEPLIFLGTNADIADGTEAGEAALLEAYRASRAMPVDAPASDEAVVFAYDDFGTPGVIAERDHVEDLDIVRLRFENNVRLNVKQTAFEDDRVRVRVRLGAGRLALPRELPGLNYLVSGPFIAGGLDAHSFDDLQSLLAGNNVGLGFSVSGDAFSFSATTTPEDLALQLKLFAAYTVAPGYGAEALARFQRAVDVNYDSLDATPGGVASRDVPRLLVSGDPRFGMPPKDVLKARTFEELAAVLGPALSVGEIEISLVGDVDEATAVRVVAESFGALPLRADNTDPYDDARRVRFPEPTPEPIVLRHAGEADRALMLTYWPTTDNHDTRRFAVVSLLEGVLGLKLIDRVREADGATYSPRSRSSMSSVSPGYGYLSVSLDLEPDQVDPYFAVIDEVVATLVAGDISEDELHRARQPILEDLEQSEESNGAWLGIVSIAQTQPRFLDVHRNYPGILASVTIDEIVSAAQEYLNPDKAFRVAILPPEGGGPVEGLDAP